MNDVARHAIPRRFDDPERWLFWTVDEAAVLLGPSVLLPWRAFDERSEIYVNAGCRCG